MSLIAEGVETKEQLDYLSGLGCHVVQGFLFGQATQMKDVERQFHQNLTLLKGMSGS
jgi:EAL domain-containing protein (putative c-di-GMP-specific phosphodiesterase class I)